MMKMNNNSYYLFTILQNNTKAILSVDKYLRNRIMCNLDEGEVLKKPDEAFKANEKIKEGGKDFREMSPGELIEYIESTHHVYVKKSLPELSELTIKIMRVYGANHEVLFKVHELFSKLKAELERHLIKEEENLFPLIKEYSRDSSAELYRFQAQLVLIGKTLIEYHLANSLKASRLSSSTLDEIVSILSFPEICNSSILLKSITT